MRLSWVSANEYKNSELAERVRRIQKLTESEDDAKLYEQNEATLMKLLQGILRLSRQEGEWLLYFYALGEIIYLADTCANYPVIVKYAEIYYKDSDLYGNREIFYHAGEDMGWINTWICANIFDAYMGYHQVDDGGMNGFMQKYEDVSLLYDDAGRYYIKEMELGLLYWDMDMTEHGKTCFEKYFHKVGYCYFCTRRAYQQYYLIKDQTDLAEEFMLLSLQGKAPKGYRSCGRHNASRAYGQLLYDCLLMGKTEAFLYFREKYWRKQPEETRRELACKNTLDAYCCAIDGEFGSLERVLQLVWEDVQNSAKYTTMSSMLDCLEWWCYFRLLDRSGVHEVTIDMTYVSKNENGKVSCLALSDFFEQRADDYGMKLARARGKYKYTDRKETYRECAGL